MKNPRKYDITAFRMAMDKVGASATAISRELICSPGTVYSYLKRYPELKAHFEALKGGQVEEKPLYPKEVFERAIKISHGVKSAVAAIVGCSRQTVDNAMERWPELRDQLDGARAVLVGMAAGALVDDINNVNSKGHLQAYMFALKTFGKDEGFVERNEVTGADGAALLDIPPDLMKQLEATGLNVVEVLRNLAAMKQAEVG